MSGSALEDLLNEGWPVAAKQLDDFFGGVAPVQDLNKLRKCLLDGDMRDYAVPVLADRFNRQLGEFKGPLVVQVVKLRNVSYPKYSETTHTDGLMKIQLSDGFSNIQAVQPEPNAKLNADTAPGTKVRLIGRILIENGMLVINGTNCQVLGGTVEKLAEKWNMEKGWQQKPMRSAEDNAPRWIQFSKQRPPQSSLPENAANRMFRANDVISGLAKTTADDRGADFDASRKAQIEQAIENNAVKKFARSQLKMKAPENTASTSYSNTNKRDVMVKSKPIPAEPNKNRRSGRDDKRNVSPVHRPSNPPTLFDFVQTKVPISDGPREQDYVPDFAKAEKVEAGERHDDQQGVYRAGRNKYIDKGMVSVPRNQQNRGKATGTRTLEISNSNRYRRQYSSRPEHNNEPNHFANLSNDKYRQNCAQNYPSVAALSQGLAETHIAHTELPDDGAAARSYNATQPAVFYLNRSHNFQSNITGQPVYEQQQQQQQQPNTFPMNVGMPTWKIGDKCLAPWSDGQFYPSTLVSMGPADMCTIEYDEYGNRSSVPIGVLLPQTF